MFGYYRKSRAEDAGNFEGGFAKMGHLYSAIWDVRGQMRIGGQE